MQMKMIYLRWTSDDANSQCGVIILHSFNETIIVTDELRSRLQ